MTTNNFKPVNKKLVFGADVYEHTPYYIATNYDISTENADNTPALQNLIDKISESGGGTIFFPVGTYCFGIGGYLTHKSNIPYAVEMKSNVSIVGENMEKTILKQICVKKEDNQTLQPYSLFVYLNPENEPKPDENGNPVPPEIFVPITGCTYSNFTVDASETDAVFECNEDGSVKKSDDYPYYAKAFYYQFVKDCVFRDLILCDTIATALGIDYLDRVQIENVNCYNCGKKYVAGATGSAGIGIGTGGWENENFYIHNCTCVESGQFGIFIENQLYLGWGPENGSTLARGCIISNCIARNGRNKGIGIRGGQDVLVTGCEAYKNKSDGFYIDGKCKNIKIDGCNSSFNKANGIYVKPSKKRDGLPDYITETSYQIIVSNNTFEGNDFDGINAAPVSSLSTLVLKDNVLLSNQLKGIRLANGFTAPVIMGNYVDEGTALSIDAATYQDCVVKDNVLFDSIENFGVFTGEKSCTELSANANIVKRISYNEFDNAKINNIGKLDASYNSENDACLLFGFFDISSMPSSFYIVLSHNVDSIRVAEYSSNNESSTLHTSDNKAEFIPLWNDGNCNHIVKFQKSASAKYIRICISRKNFKNLSDSNFSVVISK